MCTYCGTDQQFVQSRRLIDLSLTLYLYFSVPPILVEIVEILGAVYVTLSFSVKINPTLTVEIINSRRNLNAGQFPTLLCQAITPYKTLPVSFFLTISGTVRKGATLESSFPPLPAHGVYGTGPSGPHPG